jgi:glucose/arabinose dehydrogenase
MNRLVMIALALATTGSAGCKEKPAQPVQPRDSGSGSTIADGSGDPPSPTETAPAQGVPSGSDALGDVPKSVVDRIALKPIATGLKRPVAAVVAPGDTRKRVFIVEQHKARIRVLENGALAQAPFFDLGAKNISTGGEQGLLGLAFHPAFATNGKLYVHYTAPDDSTHIVEYQVGKTDRDHVDMATAREVYTHSQPYSNHNGGHLAFGPDGRLYIGLGDGGAAGDPLEAGQDLKQELAKMLRLDVDTPGAKVEIAHYGLRNPWRYAFDAKTGDLYIGDVGQDKWEYVFVVAAGDGRKNFGWSVAEGRHCYEKKNCDRSGFTEPVADYPHSQGCSITGGVVYRGKALPELDGVYFYADYCTNIVRSFRWYKDASSPSGGAIRDHWEWRAALDPDEQLQSISSFGVDADGEVYIVSLAGVVFQLVPKP